MFDDVPNRQHPSRIWGNAILFVLSQRTTFDPTVSAGNFLHVLSVGSDGAISETVPDAPLSVAVGVRP
jgi:hypothetical protein